MGRGNSCPMNSENKSPEPAGRVRQAAARIPSPHSTLSAYAIDVAGNRQARKWSRGELIGRALWEVLRNPLFKWNPRPMWVWRRGVLRLFGAVIGRDVRIHPSARIAMPWNLRIGDDATVGDQAILYALGPITIGSQATISQNAHLCAGTHDYRRSDMPLLKTPITVCRGRFGLRRCVRGAGRYRRRILSWAPVRWF